MDHIQCANIAMGWRQKMDGAKRGGKESGTTPKESHTNNKTAQDKGTRETKDGKEQDRVAHRFVFT